MAEREVWVLLVNGIVEAAGGEDFVREHSKVASIDPVRYVPASELDAARAEVERLREWRRMATGVVRSAKKQSEETGGALFELATQLLSEVKP